MAVDLAAGGLVIDPQGRVLLREPRGHYYGYVWTFAKGKPDPGESLEDAALREVLEETGVPGKIVARIPGVFATADSETVFFLMTPAPPYGPFDPAETKAIRWEAPEAARELIGQTHNELGKRRDLAVLDAALRFWTGRAAADAADDDTPG